MDWILEKRNKNAQITIATLKAIGTTKVISTYLNDADSILKVIIAMSLEAMEENEVMVLRDFSSNCALRNPFR